MYPFFHVWAPQIYFPFGNGFTETISPNTDWFSNISSKTGDADIEREVVSEQASYGTQIGNLSKVVLALAEKSDGLGVDALAAISELKETAEFVAKTIENIKNKKLAAARAAFEVLSPEEKAIFLQQFGK